MKKLLDAENLSYEQIKELLKGNKLIEEARLGTTTYKKEAEKFKSLYRLDLRRTVEFLFKNPEYDVERFKQLEEIINLLREKYAIGIGPVISPSSRAKWMRALISSGFLGVAGIFASGISSYDGMMVAVSAGTALFGFSGASVIYFDLEGSYENLINGAEIAEKIFKQIDKEQYHP